MNEPAHGPDPKMKLSRPRRHQQHVARLGLGNPHQHPIKQTPIATPQRIPARNFAEITASPKCQRDQPDTIEPVRPPPMQPKPSPHRRDGGVRNPAQAPGYRVSRSIPGRYGSPRKFTAFPNRPAHVARLLSHPSTTSTNTPASTANAGTARNVTATPAPRATALSNPQFAPPNQRNSPPPSPSALESSVTTAPSHAPTRANRRRPAIATRHRRSPSSARHSGEVSSTTARSSAALAPRNSAVNPPSLNSTAPITPSPNSTREVVSVQSTANSSR